MSRNARSRLVGLVAALHTAAAAGCSAYSEGAGDREEDLPGEPPRVATGARTTPRLALKPEPPLEPVPAADPPAQPHNEPMSMENAPPVDMPEPPIHVEDKNGYADLRVERSSRFDGYLTDGFGRALYMFVDDVAGSEQTACLGECALEWPAFSPRVVSPSAELDPTDIARFHRDDGAWQTTYKGHALYYRASELGTRDVTGDGVDERWFVARDYVVFLSAARKFTPAGGTTMDSSFLTDSFGRTLYICLDDQPGTAISEAISSCDTSCSAKRPAFAAAETARITRVPSLLDPSELVRADGLQQLTYRGWPLYLYVGDVGAGSTEGHNDRAWRAIDPVSFGLTDQ